jgi:hypothetical protein
VTAKAERRNAPLIPGFRADDCENPFDCEFTSIIRIRSSPGCPYGSLHYWILRDQRHTDERRTKQIASGNLVCPSASVNVEDVNEIVKLT